MRRVAPYSPAIVMAGWSLTVELGGDMAPLWLVLTLIATLRMGAELRERYRDE